MSDRRSELRRSLVRGLVATAGAAVISNVNLPFRDSDGGNDNGGNVSTPEVPVNPSADQVVASFSRRNLFTGSRRALAQCVPAIILPIDHSKTAEFVIYGERLVNGVNIGETAEGVDLRLSLAQDPKNTYMWGTFKTGKYQERDGFATLIKMGPVINGTEHGKPILDLLGKRFLIEGAYDYDYEALIEDCGIVIPAQAWKVDVERILKNEKNERIFRYEFSFGVVPNCGLAEREYIDNVTREVRNPAVPTRTRVAPPTDFGAPGRQPAQIPPTPGALPGAGDGSVEIPDLNPNIPRRPGH